MKYCNFKIPMCLVTAVLLLCMLVPASVCAETENSDYKGGKVVTPFVSEDENAYTAYHEKNSNTDNAHKDITVSANTAVILKGAELQPFYSSPSGMKKNNVLRL